MPARIEDYLRNVTFDRKPCPRNLARLRGADAEQKSVVGRGECNISQTAFLARGTQEKTTSSDRIKRMETSAGVAAKLK